jgi:hypothetical protein
MDPKSTAESERAIVKLLELEYDFFHCLSLVPCVHPCAAEQLHADFAIEYRYDVYIGNLRGTTLVDAERVIEASRSVFPNSEAYVHASAWVRTIVSIHGGQWRDRDDAASVTSVDRTQPLVKRL